MVSRTKATKVTRTQICFLVHPLFTLFEVSYARIGKIHFHHWRGRDGRGFADVERLRAKMAWPITRRHSHRARTFFILFSHRHLYRYQHCLEFASVAFLDFPAVKAMRGRIAPQKLREIDRGLFFFA